MYRPELATRTCAINEDQVRKYLEPRKLIQALEVAFGRDFRNTVSAPPRMRLDLPSGAVFFTMPCHDAAIPAFGVKLVSVGESVNGGDRVQADYVLFNPATRRIAATIAANYLTDIRTAAVSAIATKLLARDELTTLGIYGTGRQALAHILVFSAILPFTTILCCGTQEQKTRAFASRVGEEHAIEVQATTAEECATRSDVLCTCTTSVRPLFKGSLLRPGTHLNLVGTFQRDATEVDSETVRRARVVVDTYEGAFSEAGDILMPIAQGIIRKEHVTADLHELLSGEKPGRQNSEEITLFKSVGHAYEDLIAANLVYERAAER